MVDHPRRRTRLQDLGLAKVASPLPSRIEAQSSCLPPWLLLRRGHPRGPLEVGETRAGPGCCGNCPPLFLPGVSATSGTSGLPDMTGSVYNKTQVREAWRWGARRGQVPPSWPSLSSLCPADVWQAGIPCRDSTPVQPALGLGLHRAPGPWSSARVRAPTVPAHPARPPAASLTAAAPPPPAGCSGELVEAAAAWPCTPRWVVMVRSSLDCLLSSSEWLQSAQPAQHTAAQVASLQTCLRQLSILDKLKPEAGWASPGQEKTHGAHFSGSPAPFPRIPETCNCVSRASVGEPASQTRCCM